MRELEIQNFYLGKSKTCLDAFQVAFSKEILEKTHGGPVDLSEWKQDQGKKERRMRIKSPLPAGFPDVLRKFLGKENDIQATVRQVATLDEHENKCTIKNKTRFHIVGSKLLRFGSFFVLSWNDQNDVYMTAHVRVRALLPPPFKAIAEGLIIETSRHNLDVYFKTISNALHESFS